MVQIRRSARSAAAVLVGLAAAASAGTASAAPVAAQAETPSADFSASINVPDKVRAGRQFDISLTLRNAGPSAGSGVVGIITLPQGLKIVSAYTAPEVETRISNDRTNVNWVLTPAVKSNRLVNFAVRVVADPGVYGMATVAAGGGARQTTDPNPSNNSALGKVYLEPAGTR